MTLRTWAPALSLLLATASGAAPIYGDVSGNGIIDYRDAIILLRVAGGLRANSDAVRRTGDVAPVSDYNGGSFGDGKITILDALRVFRKAGGLSTAAWPAKQSGYVLEAGNTTTLRKYSASGIAVTGPDQDVPDPVTMMTGPFTETIGGASVPGVFVVKDNAGSEEHFVQVQDGSGTPVSLQATRLVFGGNAATFNPPLVLARYPFQDGANWAGQTVATDVATSLQFPADYTGSVQGPVIVTMADQMHAFDNAWKVTISYTTPSPGPTGTEYFWFVPFLGAVQHGYSRSIYSTTTTIVPDYKMVSANVHGVLYP